MQEIPEKSQTSLPSVIGLSRRLTIAGLIVLGLAAAGLWGWWSMRETSATLALPPQPALQPLPPAPVEPVVTAVAANAFAQITMRLAELEAQFERLKAAPSTVQDPAAIAQLDDAVRNITGGMDAINTAVATLNARLGAVEAVQAAQPLGGEAKRISYALGLRELERALGGSGPFTVQLETLASLPDDPASADPSIARLRPYAASGIKPRALLAARFDAAAASIVRADSLSGVPKGWAGRTYAFILSLIMIRPTGEREGSDVPSLVARAQARLEAGDLDAALMELDALKGEAAAAAAPWVSDARARLAAEQALAQLTAALTQHLNNSAAHAPSAATPLPEKAGE